MSNRYHNSNLTGMAKTDHQFVTMLLVLCLMFTSLGAAPLKDNGAEKVEVILMAGSLDEARNTRPRAGAR